MSQEAENSKLLFFFSLGLNSSCKQAKAIAEKDELAKCISMWTSLGRDHRTFLNEWQNEAMDKALQKPFQLIQGPPGTL